MSVPRCVVVHRPASETPSDIRRITLSIVVTGAAGFLGSTLVPALCTAGYASVTLDRRPLPAATASLPGVTPVQTELTEPSSDCFDALHQATAVVHLAGCPGVRDAGADVAFRRHRDNVLAVRTVLGATPAGTPVIVASSSSVYGGAVVDRHGSGWPHGVRASQEGDELHARGGYAASKIRAENVCRERADRGGHVLVVRPFTVVGERQRPDMAVSRWAAEAAATGWVTVLGAADRTRDVTDVRDVARSLLALLHVGRTGTVNIGSGRGHSLAELAEAVCAAIGRETRVRVRPAGPAEVAHTRADTGRLLAWTGQLPRTDLREVVTRAVSSLAQHRSADAPTAAYGELVRG